MVIKAVDHFTHQLRNTAAQLHLNRVLMRRHADLFRRDRLAQAHRAGLFEQGIQLLFQPIVHAVRVQGRAQMGDQSLK